MLVEGSNVLAAVLPGPVSVLPGRCCPLLLAGEGTWYAIGLGLRPGLGVMGLLTLGLFPAWPWAARALALAAASKGPTEPAGG